VTCRLFALLLAYLFKFSGEDVMSGVLCDLPVTCACMIIYCASGHSGAGKRVHFFLQHCEHGTAHTFFASFCVGWR